MNDTKLHIFYEARRHNVGTCLVNNSVMHFPVQLGAAYFHQLLAVVSRLEVLMGSKMQLNGRKYGNAMCN